MEYKPMPKAMPMPMPAPMPMPMPAPMPITQHPMMYQGAHDQTVVVENIQLQQPYMPVPVHHVPHYAPVHHLAKVMVHPVGTTTAAILVLFILLVIVTRARFAV